MCRDLGLDLRHMRERPVPARLQFARDQPVGWIGSIVLPEGAVGGVARRFGVAAEGPAPPTPPLARPASGGAGGGPAPLTPPLARLLLGGCGGGDRAGTIHVRETPSDNNALL